VLPQHIKIYSFIFPSMNSTQSVYCLSYLVIGKFTIFGNSHPFNHYFIDLDKFVIHFDESYTYFHAMFIIVVACCSCSVHMYFELFVVDFVSKMYISYKYYRSMKFLRIFCEIS
jgi:hypothetical protein